MAPPFGNVLRQAREISGLTAVNASRAAGISTAYLSKLESDCVKKPSPQILQRLGDVLAVPYADLMRLNGYPVPSVPVAGIRNLASAALFDGLNDDERDELLEYLAWYRARKRTSSRRRHVLVV